MAAEALLEGNVGKKKCFDGFDLDDRHEGWLYCLPETNARLNQRRDILSGNCLKQSAFNHETICIAGSRLTLDPILPTNVKVYSLDSSKLNIGDLSYILGASEGAQNTLGFIEYEYGNLSLNDLVDTLKKLRNDPRVHAASVSSLLRSISRIQNSGIFDTRFPAYDIQKSMEDIDTITSFSTSLIENEDARALATGLLCKQIVEAKKQRLTSNKVVLYCREVSYITGKYADQRMGLARKYLMEILRVGRDLQISAIFCSQMQRDFSVSFRRLLGGILQMKTDYSDALGLKDIGDVPHNILGKLPRLAAGVGLLMTGDGFEYPVFTLPARHLHKKEGMNVIALLIKEFGKIDYSGILVSNNNDPQILEPPSKKEKLKPEFFGGETFLG